VGTGVGETTETATGGTASAGGASDGGVSEAGASDGGASEGVASGSATSPIHRVRELDRRDRRLAAGIGAALLLGPLVAVAVFIRDWTPGGDPALMALRALDVGTADTPMIGQPSSSNLYAGSRAAHHPGPLHFYLLALPVRVLGGATGMLLVSAVITGTALLASAWAIFRQLGRTGGVLAAVLLAAVAFTTGASSLVNPVSSSIAGYPLLLSAVLLWCVACGDVRLLPLTAAAVSFAVQQHLAVAIASLVATIGAAALLALTARREAWRHDRGARRDLRRGATGAAMVVAVLWAPVLAQQVIGDVGNLGQIVWFAREGNGETLGLGSGVGQLAHVVSIPPLLGRTEVTGQSFITRPTPLDWVTAAAVVALVAWLGWRWRSIRPRYAALCAMAGVLAIAGVLNGSSVPRGLEEGRIVFYHWAWPLTLFVGLALGLAAAGAVRRRAPEPSPIGRPVRPARRALAGMAVAAVAAPSLVNPLLDRHTNTLPAAHARIERGVVDDLVDQVLAGSGDLGGPTALLARNEPMFAGMSAALAFRLTERGVDVRFPRWLWAFVAEDRLASRADVEGALMVVFDEDLPTEAPPGGELVAEHRFVDERFDVAAYRRLVAAARDADRVRHGPALAQVVDDVAAEERAFIEALFDQVLDDPESALSSRPVVGLLLEYPPVEPALDTADLARVEATLLADEAPGGVTGIRIFRLDRDETLTTARRNELGRPDGDPD
jgi:hypothetical protein